MNDDFFDYVDFKGLLPLIENPNIIEVQYNGREVWVKEVDGQDRIEKCNITDDEIMIIAKQCANKEKTYFNDLNPILDADVDIGLAYTLRINVLHPILSKKITMTVRKVTTHMLLTDEKIVTENYMTKSVLELLIAITKSGCNILVSGIAGVGKTELIKYFTSFIDESKKLITIEDARELNLLHLFPNRNIESLETSTKIGYKELIKSSLRHSPDYIIIAEMRGKEVEDVISSVLSGHKLISTIHAKDSSMIPDRMMAMMDMDGKSELEVRKIIHSIIDFGIHIELIERERRVVQICEYTFDSQGVPVTNIVYSLSINAENEIIHTSHKLSSKNNARYTSSGQYKKLKISGWL